MITKVAKYISAIISPLWLPTAAIVMLMLTTQLALLPLSARITVAAVVLVVTGIIPLGMLQIMIKRGYISDLDVSNRLQRTSPFVIILVCYLGCTLFLSMIHMPQFVVNVMQGASLAVLAMIIISFWWKISAHGAAIGALLAVVFREGTQLVTLTPMMPWLIVITVLAALVGMARIILGSHTLPQVFAGWLLGFLCVIATTI